MIAAQVRRSEAASWASNAATRFGVPSPVTSTPPASFVNVPELAGTVISQLAHQLGDQDPARAAAARERAGDAG